MTPLLAIGPGPLTLEPLIAAVCDRAAASGSDGAVATFLGLVRNHNAGRSVRYLEYEAYEPLALKSFERIGVEVAGRWPHDLIRTGGEPADGHRGGRRVLRTRRRDRYQHQVDRLAGRSPR